MAGQVPSELMRPAATNGSHRRTWQRLLRLSVAGPGGNRWSRFNRLRKESFLCAI